MLSKARLTKKTVAASATTIDKSNKSSNSRKRLGQASSNGSSTAVSKEGEEARKLKKKRLTLIALQAAYDSHNNKI